MLKKMERLPTLSFGQWADWELAYDQAVDRHFFTSPHWGRVLVRAYGLKHYILIFQFTDRQVKVILPCFVKRRIRGTLIELISMPPYHYGGLLCSQPLDTTMMGSILRCLNRTWWLHTLIMSASPRGGMVGWESFQSNCFTSHVLDLAMGYSSIWESKFDAKQRNSIRKAQRSGLGIRKDNSDSAIASFYEMYLKSCQRWGQVQLEPRIFYDSLVRDTKIVDLWMASKDRKDIAGVIVAHNERDTAYYLANASDETYWHYCPNNLLLASVIEDACERSLSQFDFLPSGRIASVEKFKESFGAVLSIVPEFWVKGYLPTLKCRTLEWWGDLIKRETNNASS